LRHGDGTVRKVELFLRECFRQTDAIAHALQAAGSPERTLKRRFKAATVVPLIDYLMNVRIEHSERLLETTALPVEEIIAEAGYSDGSFFRRLFKRLVGLTPAAFGRCSASLNPSLPLSSPPKAIRG
jgi:transcriptional regulator GlxA family with amidase domain